MVDFHALLANFPLTKIPCPYTYRIARGPVAQLVEQLTFNQWVTGSNPVGLTTFTGTAGRFSVSVSGLS